VPPIRATLPDLDPSSAPWAANFGPNSEESDWSTERDSTGGDSVRTQPRKIEANVDMATTIECDGVSLTNKTCTVDASQRYQ